MANLTKTQINYFSERLSAAIRKLFENLTNKSDQEMPPLFSLKDKVHMIASGKANFKFDEIMKKAEGGFSIGMLDEAFEFPGECEAKGIRSVRTENLKRFLTYLNNRKSKWVDDFVLGKIEEPDRFVQNLPDRVDEFYSLFKEGKF